jgi:hypothetical protein
VYQVHVTLTNEDEGYIFGEYTEDAAEWFKTSGDLYRVFQREYGRCRSKIYVNTPAGTKAVGWYFESRQRYEDTNEPYLRGAWVTYKAIPADDGPQ